MKKPIKEWLEEITDKDIREKALKNYEETDQEVGSMKQALSHGFVWTETKEGYDYWLETAKSI